MAAQERRAAEPQPKWETKQTEETRGVQSGRRQRNGGQEDWWQRICRRSSSWQRRFGLSSQEGHPPKLFQLFHLPHFGIGLIVNQMVKYDSRLDNVFGALADPTRRCLLETLSRGAQCVTALARPHRMSLPAISKHLRVLEHAGLICRRRNGRVHHLKLEAKPMREAAQWIEEYRKFWEGALDSLAAYLEKTNQTEQTTEKKGKS